MDPLAHTLVGATLARTRLRDGAGAMAVAAGVLAANAPDIDAVTMFVSRDLSLGFRRGWTHGVLAMAVLPLLLTAVLLAVDRLWARRRGRGPTARAGPLLRLTAAGVWSHPLLDWLNTYGVRLLMPFDDAWFYGDALFIIDPWVWLLAGLTVVLASPATWASAAGWAALAAAATAVTAIVIGFGRFADTPPPTAAAWGAGLAAVVWLRATGRGRRRLPQVAAACLAAVAVYAGGMALASQSAERFAATLLARQYGAAPVDVLAIPVPGNVFRRGIVAVYPDTYRFFELDPLAAPPLRRTAAPRPRGPEGPIVEAALTAPHVRGMAVWKRFPAYTVTETAEGWVVTISDMRYARRPGAGLGGATVRLDRDLNVLAPPPAGDAMEPPARGKERRREAGP